MAIFWMRSHTFLLALHPCLHKSRHWLVLKSGVK